MRLAGLIVSSIVFLGLNIGAKICPLDTAAECTAHLRNYPLFDNDYNLAANYVPILPLRALAHADVYREKKSFKLERFFYVKNLSGELGKAYETVILSGEVSGFGIFSRKITVKGKLNEFDLLYENQMSFSVPRNASMKVNAKLDGIPFLELKVKSDGTALTNEVEGSFFGKPVKYYTAHRDTMGTLAGINYKVYAEGVVKEDDRFYATMNGKVGNHLISGSCKMTSDSVYQCSEDYGPITVKSFVTIN